VLCLAAQSSRNVGASLINLVGDSVSGWRQSEQSGWWFRHINRMRQRYCKRNDGSAKVMA
jgi:hypothetical protein